MHSSCQDKEREQGFWDKVACERIYAAFDHAEYMHVFDMALGRDLEGKCLVDVGCASGVSAALLASRGARVVGVDISKELVSQARRLWESFATAVEFRVGDAEHLAMEAESKDGCFFGGVLHHFPERRGVYREALRVLRRGGKFVALEPNLLDFLERIEWTVAGLRGKLSPNEYPIDPRGMKQELEEAGFRDVRFWNTRHDIPFLAQIVLLKRFFGRQKGTWLKGPALKVINALRPPPCRGTFFVMEASKP